MTYHINCSFMHGFDSSGYLFCMRCGWYVRQVPIKQCLLVFTSCNCCFGSWETFIRLKLETICSWFPKHCHRHRSWVILVYRWQFFAFSIFRSKGKRVLSPGIVLTYSISCVDIACLIKTSQVLCIIALSRNNRVNVV